jgi:O-antigen/teichoic acid export membrane protein
LLGVLGGPLVRFVYGARWADAAGPLAFLAVVGASRVALELAYDFLVSAGESDAAFRLNVLWLVALVPTLIVAAEVGGITAVAAGHVVALGVVVLPAYLRVLLRLGVTVPSIVGPITRPLVGGALMAVTAAAAMAAMPTDFTRLVAGGTLSVVVYAAVVGLPLWRQHRRGELFSVAAAPSVVEAAA